MRLLRFVLPAFAFFAGSARAELPPADRPIPAVIDDQVRQKLAAENVAPAPLADDATIVRRLTLDLVGRMPTTPELDAYLASAEPDKRTKLIDRLLASPAFARFQAAQFDAMLNEKPGSGELKTYLAAALKENRPWDAVFRELMLPDPAPAAATKGAADFLKPRLADADKLTNDVSVNFFGVNVSCAQCHDHPLVKDWTQDHFFGMKAFLVRTYDAGGFVAERGQGQVKYKPNKGPEKTALMMFLTGTKVTTGTDREPTKEEQKQEKEASDKAKAKKEAPPKPAVSGRAKLVETALAAAESDYFAKAIVNRLWHRFFGYGLVMPLDQMHSENPPSHPDLMTWLARDLRANKYDLKRLVRGLVGSDAYARSSRYPSAAAPAAQFFAAARLKPLTPQQLATSLKIAATDPQAFAGLKPDDFEKRIESMESAGRGFASLIAQPTDNFQIGVGEALLFSNGDRLTREFLTDGPGSLLGRAKDVKTPAGMVPLMVRTALGRPANADEAAALTGYLTARPDRQPEAYRQALWALVTCPEFRFNH